MTQCSTGRDGMASPQTGPPFPLGGIDIGDDVMIGPNVQLISGGHPLDPETRRSAYTSAPIRI